MADREIKKGRREMGKRAEVEEAERLLLIKECLAKRMRIREAARRAGVHPSTICQQMHRKEQALITIASKII